MVNFNAEIHPYQSLGNIEIGKNISNYENFFLSNGYYPLEKKINERFSIKYYNFPDKLSVVYKDGVVVGITAEKNYLGMYENKIYVGISFGELKKISKNMAIVNGGIIFENNYGMVLWLSSPYNELCDNINDLQDQAYIDSITVGNYDEWRNFTF